MTTNRLWELNNFSLDSGSLPTLTGVPVCRRILVFAPRGTGGGGPAPSGTSRPGKVSSQTEFPTGFRDSTYDAHTTSTTTTHSSTTPSTDTRLLSDINTPKRPKPLPLSSFPGTLGPPCHFGPRSALFPFFQWVRSARERPFPSPEGTVLGSRGVQGLSVPPKNPRQFPSRTRKSHGGHEGLPKSLPKKKDGSGLTTQQPGTRRARVGYPRELRVPVTFSLRRCPRRQTLPRKEYLRPFPVSPLLVSQHIVGFLPPVF